MMSSPNPPRAASSRVFSSAADGGSTNTLTTSARIFAIELLRALPVDVEQHVAAGGERGLDRLARRAVAIAVHLGLFEQLVGVAHRLEAAPRDEMVVHAVDLARAPLRASSPRSTG